MNIIDKFKKLYPGQNIVEYPLQNHQNLDLKIYSREDDSSIFLENLANDEYFFKHFLFAFSELSKQNASFINVVDLGAHAGGFTCIHAASYPETNFYAIEQNKKNFEALSLNSENIIDNTGVNNINLFNGIIKGNRDILSVLEEENNTGGHKIIFSDKQEDTKNENFNSLTLREFMEVNNLEKINFLKIDIEGSEYDVLEAAFEDGIIEKIDIISMEYHVNPTKNRNYDTVFKYLGSFDSVIVQRLSERKENDPSSGGYHILAYRLASKKGDRYFTSLGYEEINKTFEFLRKKSFSGINLVMHENK